MTTWPLDNTLYTAQSIGAFTGTRTRGVFSADDCFEVSAIGNFELQVQGGLAWLQKEKYWGVAVLETLPTVFSIDIGSGALQRYVAVVLQLDKTANLSRLVLKYGEYGDEKPLPVRDEFYDEIILAYCLQKAGAVELTSADITDTRLDEDLCGLMRDGVTGIPTSSLNNKLSQFINSIEAELKSVEDKEGLMLMARYDPQNIGLDVTLQPYEHASLSVLNGSGAHGTFIAQFSGDVEFFTNADQSEKYTAKLNGELSSISIIQGAFYQFYLSNERIENEITVYDINFKQGGAALAYKIIASTTEPANPKENTFWVQTNTPCDSYAFSTSEPTPQDGKVWIITNRTSNYTFNAHEKNEMIVNPTGIKQYENGAYVTKFAKIYKNNEWVDFSVIFMQNNVAHIPITGYHFFSGVTPTHGSQGFYWSGGEKNGYYYWLYDVTNYNTLRATVSIQTGGTHNNTVSLFIYTSSGTLVAGSNFSTTNISNVSTAVDISNLTGTVRLAIVNRGWIDSNYVYVKPQIIEMT